MKRILLISLLIGNYAFAQVKNGEQVPEIEFKIILNGPFKNAKLSNLKGKIVLLEFWATWCSPCVAAMPHLQELQEKFKKELQVITITYETDKRVGLFLKSKPSNLWFAIDTCTYLNSLFIHRTIPHSVLIDADGKLIANTLPDQITASVIEKLIKKEPVNLEAKVDNMSRDFAKDYFSAADTVKTRLMIQAEIKGAPSMLQRFLANPVFAERRLMMINLPLQTLYRIAYGDLADGRVIDLTSNEKKNKKELFCLDLITKTPEELLPTLKSELLKRFELQARMDQILKPVYVLKIENIKKVNKILENKSVGKGKYGGGEGTFSGDGVVFKDIADYLEGFGIVDLPVVDETNIKRKFNIQLAYQKENPESLSKVLSDIGLKLEKTERKIDMLTLYK